MSFSPQGAFESVRVSASAPSGITRGTGAPSYHFWKGRTHIWVGREKKPHGRPRYRLRWAMYTLIRHFYIAPSCEMKIEQFSSLFHGLPPVRGTDLDCPSVSSGRVVWLESGEREVFLVRYVFYSGLNNFSIASSSTVSSSRPISPLHRLPFYSFTYS